MTEYCIFWCYWLREIPKQPMHSLTEVAFATADQLALVLAWYWVVNLFLAKRIITLYLAAQKLITKDQQALETAPEFDK